jgi:hypothetical protein
VRPKKSNKQNKYSVKCRQQNICAPYFIRTGTYCEAEIIVENQKLENNLHVPRTWGELSIIMNFPHSLKNN